MSTEAKFREALSDLVTKAGDLIVLDEDGLSCGCCGMCLDDRGKGHKAGCLADAILDYSLLFVGL